MWDSRYDTEDYVYGTEPNDFLRENVERLTPGRVLCLADGEGRNGVFLAQKGFSVTSVDASGVGLRKARALARERGVDIETIQADLGDFDPGREVWDSVVSIFCHLPPEVRAALHARVVPGLVPGGTFLLEAYTPAQLEMGTGGPPTVDRMMTLEALRGELEGLIFEHAVERSRDVLEGRGHTGRGEVVQVLARKPA